MKKTDKKKVTKEVKKSKEKTKLTPKGDNKKVEQEKITKKSCNKGYNLFIILGIVFLVYFLLTWIVPGSYYNAGLQDLGSYPMGFPQIFSIVLQSFGYFAGPFIFILMVGAFYGILEITGAYRKLLNSIVEKTKKTKLLVLILSMVFIAIISSVVGLDLGLFIIFPFLISLFVLMGYDKIISVIAVLGSTIVGIFGSTFAYTTYSINNMILGTTMMDGIMLKLILLVAGIGILIGFVILLINWKKKHAKQEEIDDLVEDVVIEKKGCSKGWPIILVLSLILAIIVLGTINWSAVFNVTWFQDMYQKIMTWTIKDTAVFGKLLQGIQPFGSWIEPARYSSYAIIVLLGTIFLGIVYPIKFKEFLKAMLDGAKKYLGTAILIMIAYSILVMATSFPIFLTITDKVMSYFEKFNIVAGSFTSLIGGAIHVDMYYYPQYALQYYQELSGVNVNILNVLFVSTYSLAMLIAPTSVLLLATLNTAKVKYMDWLKHIWILFLTLFIVAILTLTIFSIV